MANFSEIVAQCPLCEGSVVFKHKDLFPETYPVTAVPREIADRIRHNMSRCDDCRYLARLVDDLDAEEPKEGRFNAPLTVFTTE